MAGWELAIDSGADFIELDVVTPLVHGLLAAATQSSAQCSGKSYMGPGHKHATHLYHSMTMHQHAACTAPVWTSTLCMYS